MYVELQKEVQAFYPRAPDTAVSKSLKKISVKSSPNILTEVTDFPRKFLIAAFYTLSDLRRSIQLFELYLFEFFLAGPDSFTKSTSTLGNGKDCRTRLHRVGILSKCETRLSLSK